MAGNGSGTLTAKLNGTVVATKPIATSTATVNGPIEGLSSVYPGNNIVTYELEHVPGLYYSWSSNGNLVMQSNNGSSTCSFKVPSYYTGGTTDVISCYVTAGGNVVVGSFSLTVDIY
ncbi:MAG: hypothetical protein LBV47_03265 [Bacteroidales bacterium]|jgi:hypothetical protein|nr:hypothetical protein [Bacteroidales bacterium]